VPSRFHRWCCTVAKTAPLYKLLKEINGNGKQPNVLVFEGVRAEESNAREKYARIGKGVKHNNVVNARPIFNWNATEIYLYLFRKNCHSIMVIEMVYLELDVQFVHFLRNGRNIL
jgi:3'-phosphoadenosine 5'-phosphosulfate sulfotransferase (PAPS reductase)/FAD synthetase